MQFTALDEVGAPLVQEKYGVAAPDSGLSYREEPLFGVAMLASQWRCWMEWQPRLVDELSRVAILDRVFVPQPMRLTASPKKKTSKSFNYS